MTKHIQEFDNFLNEGIGIGEATKILIQNLKDGEGWIDPDWAAEMLADMTDLDIDDAEIDGAIRTLADMDLLYYSDERVASGRGEKVVFSKETPERSSERSWAGPGGSKGSSDMSMDENEDFDYNSVGEEAIEALEEAREHLREGVFAIQNAMRILKSSRYPGPAAEQIRSYILGHLEPLIDSDHGWMTRSQSIESIINDIREDAEGFGEDED